MNWKMPKKLTAGCIWAYENNPSGIMPKIFQVNSCSDPCIWDGEGTGIIRVDDASN
jgi:mannosyl-oligosaccharide alpha-1,2-mannosidase